MAQVALQADGFLIGVQMFAIVAAKTARRILVTDIVGMGIPIGFLMWKYTLAIYILQGSDRRPDFIAIRSVEFWIISLVKAVKTRHPVESHFGGFVGRAVYLNCDSANLGDTG